jgi:DNA-binding NarL/FixJ family response regulator
MPPKDGSNSIDRPADGELLALVADDDHHLRMLIAEMLVTLGIKKVAVAGDGAEAIRQFDELRPQLVVIDVAMPRMSGLAAVTHMRSIDPHTRIVMLTQDDDFESLREAMDQGVSCYIRKSNTAGQIFRLLMEFLGKAAG